MLEKLIPLWVTYCFAAATPGPAQVFIIERSLFDSRKSGQWAALGVSLGTWAWVVFVGIGMQKFSSHFPEGRAYIRFLSLFLLGFFIYKNTATIITNFVKHRIRKIPKPKKSYVSEKPSQIFFKGFLANVLNPNSVVFFMSLFGPLLTEHTDWNLYLYATLGVTVISVIWYQTVALAAQSKMFKDYLFRSENFTRLLFTCAYAYFFVKLLKQNSLNVLS
jgi:threonine/homoserine/homoserine lactone efflux protein